MIKEKIEKMQISKKIYSTLIIAVLAISVIATAIPMVSALDGAPDLYATPSFGAPVTTAQTSGPVGSKISVIGNTTFSNAAEPYALITVYWISQTGIVLGTGAADGNGNYRIDVVIPSATTGAHDIVVNDGTNVLGEAFTVEQSVSVSTTPSTKEGTTYDAKVLPGDTLTVTGHGYAGGALGSTMNITLENGTTTIDITVPVVKTNSTGSFSAVITIPTIAVADYGDWSVNATDASDSWAVAPILIDYYVTVTPGSGPSGVTITIAGRIPANMAYSLLMDTTGIGSGTSGTDGVFSNTYTIPALIAETGHTVTVKWVVATVESTKTTTFTVSTAPVITALSATTGVAGATITISGAGFTKGAKITAYLGSTVVNSTDLDSRFGPTSIITGAFTNEEFVVPALTPGIYYLLVVDEYGASTNGTTTFTITATPTTTIALNAASYYTGDALSFTITTTEANLGDMTVTIRTPSGITWWTASCNTASPASAAWSLTGVVTKRVLYQNQIMNGNPMVIPSDAPLGSWNWTITYTAASLAPASSKATGLFTVAAVPTMQTVLDAIDAMEATITDVITTTEGDIIAVINTKAGQIVADISDLDAKITSIDGAIVTLSTAVGEVQTTVSNLDMGTLGADITAIKGDVATIKTNLGTVDMAVDDLDAKVTDLADGIATVQTNLGTLQGTVTSIDNTVATINTGVGSLQADVSDVSAKADVTPVWIAVVLSLVAAIAAIFAVITIRQKIAG
jgi:hypothetical protein